MASGDAGPSGREESRRKLLSWLLGPYGFWIGRRLRLLSRGRRGRTGVVGSAGPASASSPWPDLRTSGLVTYPCELIAVGPRRTGSVGALDRFRETSTCTDCLGVSPCVARYLPPLAP